MPYSQTITKIIVILQLKKCIARYENTLLYNNTSCNNNKLQPNTVSLHSEHSSSSNIVCSGHPGWVGLEEVAHWREAGYGRVATN